MLSPYRVLDLCDERGELAAMMLGDLGADVVKIEPPGGAESRRAQPMLDRGPEHERSLAFFAFNRHKRSIVLDLAQPEDRERFLALVRGADFAFSSGPDGTLDRAGLDCEALRAVNPRIVDVRLTPFGQGGPYEGLVASDLVIAALGGPMSVQGDPDRPPLRFSIPQAWRHAGIEAAVAALVAHARMRATGEGCSVDLSAQAAMTWTMLNAMSAAAIQGDDFHRSGSALQTGPTAFKIVFECRDGHVISIGTGATLASFRPWLLEDGVVDEAWFAREDWAAYDGKIHRGEQTAIPRAELLEVLERFFRLHDKAELFVRGLELGVTAAPINTTSDLMQSPQLAARDYFVDAKLPDGTPVRAPGAFQRSTLGAFEVRRQAPGLDEHRGEILGELAAGRWRSSASDDDGVSHRGADAPSDLIHQGEDALPFTGLKVADFSWVGVGPISAKYLADHGATVVRIESENRADVLRSAVPYKDGQMGWNRSHYYGEFNSSKKGLALDLKQPASLEVGEKLVEWADVVLESFTPGAIARLGLGYERAKALNPSVIMVSSCLMGQTGPSASMAGYGFHAAAVAGFYELVGYADRAPTGPWQAYTDTIAPRFLATTLLAALDHRRRTGEGQYIDLGQMEASLHLLAPELLEVQAMGSAVARNSNRSRFAAPQGVYPCEGEDRWCAIAIETDPQWQALAKQLGRNDWAEDTDLSSHTGRFARHDELDAGIAQWTRQRERYAIQAELQAAGVSAAAVQCSSDLLKDPQYAQRGFYRWLDHPEMGNIPYSGHQFRISGYESGPRSAAPVLGGDSMEVLSELLGYDDEKIGEFFAAGIII